MLLAFNVSAKDFFLQCDSLIFKIANPIIGFKKVYIMQENKWNKIKEFEITDRKYIFKNIKPNQIKCNNKKCRVTIELEKSVNNTNFLNYKSTVINNFCSIDGSNKCYIRKIGKNLQKGYCNKIKNLEISFENNK